MYVFGNDQKRRGCYATFNIKTGEGKGAYLELPESGYIPPDSGPDAELAISPSEGAGDIGHSPIIVTGLSFAQKEKYHLVQCFSDHSYTYAFGHDPLASLLEVSFIGFLVSDDGLGWSNVIQSYCSDYKRARLVESKQYSKVYVASDKPLKGFIVGMQSSTADAHHSLQQFSMTLLLAEVQEGSAWGGAV